MLAELICELMKKQFLFLFVYNEKMNPMDSFVSAYRFYLQQKYPQIWSITIELYGISRKLKWRKSCDSKVQNLNSVFCVHLS